MMQFNDGSAGGYGGAGGAAGAVDEDDDGKQLPVDCLHTVWHIFYFTPKFAGQYCLLEATMWSVTGFATHCLVCGMLMAHWLICDVPSTQVSMCIEHVFGEWRGPGLIACRAQSQHFEE